MVTDDTRKISYKPIMSIRYRNYLLLTPLVSSSSSYLIRYPIARVYGAYIYNVNLGHAIIDYLLKLVGGKALRDKIGHVTYVIKMRLVMNSIMYYSTHLFTTIDDVYWILPI